MDLENIVVDITQRNYNTLQTIQYDVDSRYVNIKIVNNGKNVDLTNYIVSIACKKPDGKIVFNETEMIEPKQGLIKFLISEQISTTLGEVVCELKIYGKNSSVLTTQYFTINVTQPIADKHIQSTNEFRQLTIAMNEYNKWIDKIEEKYNGLEEEYAEELSGIKANHLTVSVKDFGAKGDGVSDDRLAVQSAIDSLGERGGVVYFPPTDSSYLLKSKHDSKDCCLYIPSSNIKLKGGANGLDSFNGFLKADIESNSLLLIDSDIYSFEIDSLVLDGSNKVNYVFKCDEKYSPYMTLNNAHFINGKIYAATIATYVSVFNKCIFGMSDGGLKLDGINGGPITSLTVNSCYTLQNNAIGYDLGHLTYCTFNSCASDRNDIAYYLRGVYGSSFNGCGCESSRKAFHVENARMCTINSFYGLHMGSDQSQQVDYLMEFVSGVNITLSGIYFRNTKTFKKILGLTGSKNGNENITILDGSLNKDDIDYVSNLTFKNPIKLLRYEESLKDTEITTTIENLQNVIDNLPKKINHEYNINITNETYNKSFTLNIEGFEGIGFINLTFNSGVINNLTEWQPIKFKNNNLTIIFGSVTLSNTFSHNYQEIIRCDNTKNLIVHNTTFNNLVEKCGSAISSRNGSHVISANNETSGVFGSDSQLSDFFNDGWSTIKNN